MKNTHYILLDDDDLQVALSNADLPAGLGSIRALNALINHHADEPISMVVNNSLLPVSYRGNTTQLAKYLSQESKFATVAYNEETELFTINVTNHKQPRTWVRRLEQILNAEAEAFFPFREIPPSYRRDPKIVNRFLSFATVAKTEEDGIRWYITVDKSEQS